MLYRSVLASQFKSRLLALIVVSTLHAIQFSVNEVPSKMSQTNTMKTISSDTWPTSIQMDALRRVWLHALGHDSDSRVTAGFLLCLYNGSRFPFDMTKFRILDQPVFEDCLIILQMDFRPKMEVHNALGVSGNKFEKLAENWRMNDYERLKMMAKESDDFDCLKY